MKKIINSLFRFICKLFRCDYRHLNDVYQEKLPVSFKSVKKTLLYKRLKRFVKLCIIFKKFELILEYYEYLPTSIGRCIYDILSNETKYTLFNKYINYSNIEIYSEVVLGKWSRDNHFIKVASIEKKPHNIPLLTPESQVKIIKGEKNMNLFLQHLVQEGYVIINNEHAKKLYDAGFKINNISITPIVNGFIVSIYNRNKYVLIHASTLNIACTYVSNFTGMDFEQVKLKIEAAVHLRAAYDKEDL